MPPVGLPGLVQAAQVAFDVSHKNRRAQQAEIFRQGLEGDGFARAGSPGHQAVPVAHARRKADFPSRRHGHTYFFIAGQHAVLPSRHRGAALL